MRQLCWFYGHLEMFGAGSWVGSGILGLTFGRVPVAAVALTLTTDVIGSKSKVEVLLQVFRVHAPYAAKYTM